MAGMEAGRQVGARAFPAPRFGADVWELSTEKRPLHYGGRIELERTTLSLFEERMWVYSVLYDEGGCTYLLASQLQL